MWWELIILGSPIFWVVVAIESLVLFATIKKEEGWPAFISLGLFAGVLCLFGDFNVFRWVWDNWLLTLELAGAYVLAGIIWSLLKWKILCWKVKVIYQKTVTEFLKGHESIPKYKPTATTDRAFEDWKHALSMAKWPDYDTWGRSFHSLADIIPQAHKNKSRILFWMGYWPISIFWFIFNDVIDKLFQNLYNMLSNVYKGIAEGTFRGIEDFSDEHTD